MEALILILAFANNIDIIDQSVTEVKRILAEVEKVTINYCVWLWGHLQRNESTLGILERFVSLSVIELNKTII